MSEPTPTCDVWGWTTEAPDDATVGDATADLAAVMVAGGWYYNTAQTLLMAQLNKKVARLEYTANISTHVTVAYDDLAPIAKQALMDGKESPKKALADAASIPYHVTVEYDDPEEGGQNPRYWANTQKWSGPLAAAATANQDCWDAAREGYDLVEKLGT